MAELESCPFCGGAVRIVVYSYLEYSTNSDKYGATAHCRGCGASLSIQGFEDNSDAAYAAMCEKWNRRSGN